MRRPLVEEDGMRRVRAAVAAGVVSVGMVGMAAPAGAAPARWSIVCRKADVRGFDRDRQEVTCRQQDGTTRVLYPGKGLRLVVDWDGNVILVPKQAADLTWMWPAQRGYTTSPGVLVGALTRFLTFA